jgi:hypothetical protein
MNAYEKNQVRWPHLLLLAFVFVLGIFVPLSWHRQHGRHPIEPLGRQTAKRQSTPRDTTPPTAVVVHESSLPQIEAHNQSTRPVEGTAFSGLDLGGPAVDLIQVRTQENRPLATSTFRRDVPHKDSAPQWISTVWPRSETIASRLELLRENKVTQRWAQHTLRLLDELASTERLEDPKTSELLDQLQAAVVEAKEIASSIETGALFYQLNAAAYDISRRVDVWQAAYQLASKTPHLVSEPGNPFLEVSYIDRPSAGTQEDLCTIDVSGLLAALEQYEYTRLGSDGIKIAETIKTLIASHSPEQRQLGEALDMHYRNANLRIAASSEFINRLLPPEQNESGEINGRIRGVPIWGDSWTKTRLYSRLIPDPHRIRIGMEAWGNTFSDTVASSGRVYLYNEGETAFLVRKLILVDHEGLKAKPAIAEALSDSDLIDIDSDYDGIPVVGSIVRNSARRQHDEQHFSALRETEQRVANQARNRFDHAITPRLKKVVDSFYQEVWVPLDTLDLDPTTIGLSTTEQRATSRLRVGSLQQLTAHSARPRALSNSMLSMQLHESAMNNALGQLDLDGMTISLHDLYFHIMEKLGRKVDAVPQTMPSNVVITFAQRDAVKTRCENGRVTLTLALEKLTKGTKYKWSQLLVRSHYIIESEGVKAALVRTGSIELEGKRLRTRDQIALRGVFSKLMSRSNRMPLVPEKLVSNPRLSDLSVTQKIIEDGWIGLALGRSGRHVSPQLSARNPAASTR